MTKLEAITKYYSKLVDEAVRLHRSILENDEDSNPMVMHLAVRRPEEEEESYE